MKHLPIATRMLIAALAPALLVTCLLSLWFVVEGVRGIERSELARATTVLEGLALAAGRGFETGDRALLVNIGRIALPADSIGAVRFEDLRGRELATVGSDPAPGRASDPGRPWLRRWLGSAPPVRELSRQVLPTDPSAVDAPSSALGTVVLSVDLSAAWGRQLETIARGALIACLVMAVAAIASWRLARSISDPVRRLHQAIGELARQRHPSDLPLEVGGELGQLAFGVMELSRTLDAVHDRLIEARLVATSDLHDALEVLERRNGELVVAREAAEKASASKSGFLANMSHEIRTPMNAIVGTLSLLRHGRLDADQREQLELVDRSSKTLLALIDDILDISRIESGRFALELAATDLDELLQEVSFTLANQALERGIALRVDALPEGAPRWVETDALRLKQVLFNLLSNAIKFTDEGRVELRVSCRPGDACDPGDLEGTPDLWRFGVVDTGIGIPESRQASMFGAFTQVDMSTARRYGGVGLGLFICREIVTRLGGVISLRSAPGEGTCIEVELRMRAVRRAEVASSDGKRPPVRRETASVATSGGRPGARERRTRVLAVDDQPINLRLLRRFFDHLRIDADFAQDADEARERLEVERYDVLLLDLHMPGEDGFDIARWLRDGTSFNREIPVLALTADAFDATRDRALRQGFDELLTKPVTVERVGEAISRWATARRAPVPSTASSTSPAVPSAARALRPPVTIESCARAVFGDIDFAIDALATYRDEAPGRVSALRLAFGADDRVRLFDEAHSIKGVAAVCGIVSVTEAAAEVASIVRDADRGVLGEAVERLVETLVESAAQCDDALAEVDDPVLGDS